MKELLKVKDLMGPPLFGLHPIRDFSHLDYRWTTKPFGLHPIGLPMTFGLPPFGLQRRLDYSDWTTSSFGL